MSLLQIFAEVGVQHAHIIDDAYDTGPTVALAPGTAQAFVDAIEPADLDKVGAVLGVPASDGDVVEALNDHDNVAKLFQARDQFVPHADLLFGEFLSERDSKLKQIAPLVDFLKGNGVECRTFGSDYAVEGSDVPQIVFIDLRLRENGPVQVSDAVNAYKKLRQAHALCHPFVFLMSSLKTTLAERREEFRDLAGLFASQFESMEKEQFKDLQELEAILSQYIRVLPRLRAMHKHIEGVGEAVQAAAGKAQSALLALDLADYFVLHRNTVSIEKVGLGTYISDLLLDYLVHEVESKSQVWDFAKDLDEWKLEDLPRSRFALTPAAARIYSGNLLHANVRLERELERGLGPVQGYFYLGDIFFQAKELNEAKPAIALAVVTPACDLVRPEKLRERTIFLCEGSVKSVTAASVPAGIDGLAAVVMPHPRDAAKQLLIKWNKKRLHTWHADDIAKFANAEGCIWVRVARLRPLYAIQLQHAITADLSRIGVQRPPNVLVPHGIEVFVRGDASWIQLDIDERDQATASALADSEDRESTVFVVADATVRRIRRKLQAWVDKNGQSKAVDLLRKLLALPDFEQRLMYLHHQVPQVPPEGSETIDITGYAMQSAQGLTAEESYGAAFVRPITASPYVSISGGRPVTDQQRASFVLKLVRIAT